MLIFHRKRLITTGINYFPSSNRFYSSILISKHLESSATTTTTHQVTSSLNTSTTPIAVQNRNTNTFKNSYGYSSFSTTASGTVTNSQANNMSMKTECSDDAATPYEAVVRRLYMTNLFRPMKLDLEIITLLAGYLNIPVHTDKTKIIHIAGSNGKGSTALKISKGLEHSNYKTGLFMSPHISSFRERITINSIPISEDEVVTLLPNIFDICEKQKLQATFFEIATALALSYYFSQNVDAIVLETGLGGRLDATNIFTRPALCVITTISLEHTQFLGDTIELIAKEKAGIMKYDSPVLVGRQVPNSVMRQCAHEKQVSDYFTCDDVLSEDGSKSICSSLPIKTTDTYDFDEYNSLLSKAALLLLSKQQSASGNSLLSLSTIEKAILHRPPCRFEVIEVKTAKNKETRNVVLDIAHNPQAIQNLLLKLEQVYPNCTTRFVCGFSTDKDILQCLSLLTTYTNTSAVHLVQASSGRATALDELISKVSDTANNDIIYDLNDPSVTNQVKNAIELSEDDNNQVIVVCGSAFLMAEAREALGIKEARDSDIVAQVYGSNFKHMQDNVGGTSSDAPTSSTKV